MTQQEIEARIVAIVERAEYAGRQRGIAERTNSQKQAATLRENAEVSSLLARRMAAELSEKLAEAR